MSTWLTLLLLALVAIAIVVNWGDLLGVLVLIGWGFTLIFVWWAHRIQK